MFTRKLLAFQKSAFTIKRVLKSFEQLTWDDTVVQPVFPWVFLFVSICVCALYYGPNVFSWRKVSFHRKCWLAELSSLPKRERVRAKKKSRENCTLHGGPNRDKLFARLDSASALKPEEIRKRKCWGKTPTLLRKSWTFSKNQLSKAGAGVGKHEESYNILTLFLLTQAGWTETMTKLVKLLAINFDYDVCCWKQTPRTGGKVEAGNSSLLCPVRRSFVSGI